MIKIKCLSCLLQITNELKNEYDAGRSMEINNVEFERIIEEEEEDDDEEEVCCDNAGFGFGLHEQSLPDKTPTHGKSWKHLLNWIAIFIFLVICAILAVNYIGPYLWKRVVVSGIQWEEEEFNDFQLVFVIFVSLALFPALCIPSTPSMWVAGTSFGYAYGFLLVMAGVSVGVSLPYFLGSIVRHKIQWLLDKHPKQASILRLAGEGNWLHQFEAITLIRISPLPYIIFNYAVVATNVNYSPYLLGTLVGIVPEVFIALYSGILIRSFIEATKDSKSLSAKQIIFNFIGFCASVVVTIFIGIHTKKLLDQKHKEGIHSIDQKYEEDIHTEAT